MSRKRITSTVVRSLPQLINDLEHILNELQQHARNPDVPTVSMEVTLSHDISKFLHANWPTLPKLIRQTDGSLSMANRLDGFMSRNASRLGNATKTTFMADMFVVAREPDDRTPALFVHVDKFEEYAPKLFPTLGRLPAQHELDLISMRAEEQVFAQHMQFVHIPFPDAFLAKMAPEPTPPYPENNDDN